MMVESSPSPLLPGLKASLDALLDDEDPMDSVFTAEQDAARSAAKINFRARGPELLDQATSLLWAYCLSYGNPQMARDVDIWTQVSITNAPTIVMGSPPLAPHDAYISFEGEVTWEPEHGLQLVFENGNRVCKVGPYDGRLVNNHNGA